MAERSRFTLDFREQNAKVHGRRVAEGQGRRVAEVQGRRVATRRARRVAELQWGVIARWQLLDCRVSSAAVYRWMQAGKLHQIYPGVYALGHRSLGTEGQLLAAILYAGRNAALSRATALWWWGLIDQKPAVIDVSATGRSRSLSGVRVRHRKHLNRTWHKRLPVTPVSQTLLDFAADASDRCVRKALAEAEFRGMLDVQEMQALCGRGRPGSARIRRCLERHLPQLAHTRSELEERFLALCERAGIELPEVNAAAQGLTVDALWRTERVIVELDGRAGHSSPAQLERDRRRDLLLRAAGFTVLRYTWRQVVDEPELVIADLEAALAASTRPNARTRP